MKKLNITKKQFKESQYFTNKYGNLEYVSESGKLYKTDKGNVLKFVNESITESDLSDTYSIYVYDIDWDIDDWDGDDDVENDPDLPTEVTVEVPMDVINNGSDAVDDYISNYLSDEYGYCHNGFNYDRGEEFNEKKNSDWFGVKGAKFIYHGDWNDPEVQYDGVSLNYWDVEAILLDEYREGHPEDKKDKGFDDWMALPETKSSIQSALDILVQGGCGEPIDDESEEMDESSDDEFEQEMIEEKLRNIDLDPTSDDITNALGGDAVVEVRLADEGIYDGNEDGGYVMYRDFEIEMNGHLINAKYFYDRDSGEVGEVEVEFK